MLALRGRDKGITSGVPPLSALPFGRGPTLLGFPEPDTPLRRTQVAEAARSRPPAGTGRPAAPAVLSAAGGSHRPRLGQDRRGDPDNPCRRPLPQSRQGPQMGAGAALTRRQRLLRPRQQHSRRPPAPSSAAALASAAATNRPSGAANRHNRRRPAAESPARPGG